MIVHLLNSSVMPQPGQYNLVMIDKTVFIDQVKNFFHTKQLINYIGYPQNISLINKWCDINLVTSREMIKLESGDIILIMKLKYRVPQTSLKRDNKFQSELNENDFDFYQCEYKSFK